MKTRIILIVALCFSQNAFTQKASFNRITWYGLDFSMSKMIGSEGFTNPEDIRRRFFDSWNNLVFTERDKYDLSKFYNKAILENIKHSKLRNDKVDYNLMVQNTSFELSNEKIHEIVKDYSGEGDGMGLVYIVESFDKIQKNASIWVVLFDEKSGKEIYTQKFQGEPGGAGLRNYWASAILEVMKKSGRKFPY